MLSAFSHLLKPKKVSPIITIITHKIACSVRRGNLFYQTYSEFYQENSNTRNKSREKFLIRLMRKDFKAMIQHLSI